MNLNEMNLSKLTILKLAHNKITKLSDIMGYFPNLLMLDISSNYITNLGKFSNSDEKYYDDFKIKN